MESLPINQLYGSVSLEAAKREIQHFFPPEKVLVLIKPHVTNEQKGKYLKIKANIYIFSKFSEIFKRHES